MEPASGLDDPRAPSDLKAATQVLNGQRSAVLAFDPRGRVVVWNARAASVTGWSASAVKGRPLADFLHTPSKPDLIEALAQLRSGRGWTGALDLQGPRVTALRVELSAVPVVTAGRFSGAAAVLRPLTSGHSERVIAQLSAALRYAPDALMVQDPDGRVSEWNPAAERLLGWTRPEMLGCDAARLVPSGDAATDRQVWSQLAVGQDVPAYHAHRRHRDGTEHLVLVEARAFREHGAFRGVVTTLRPWAAPNTVDLTALEGTRPAVVRDLSPRRNRPVGGPTSPPAMVLAFDKAGRISHARGALVPPRGSPDLRARTVADVFAERPSALGAVEACLAGREIEITLEWLGSRWNLCFDPLRDPSGGVLGGVCVATEDPREWASASSLAGTGAHASLGQRLALPVAPDQHRAVAVVDLAGREPLIPLLGDQPAPEDCFLDGPGTLVVVVDSPSAREEIATCVEVLREALAVPAEGGAQQEVPRAIRAGVAVSDNVHLDDLLDCARAATAQPRGSAADGARWYTPPLRPSRVRLSLAAELRHALARDELRLHYQPIVELQAATTVGAEALLRWDHPQEGLLRASSFLRLADDDPALVRDLGDWVLRQACHTTRDLRMSGTAFTVAVNVAASQIMSPEFALTLTQILEECGCAPRSLSLEVTEPDAAIDLPAMTAALARLKDLGVQLSLDDFGTGSSSLLHLRHFPVDTLKIDRSFVAGLGTNEEDGAIVASTLSLAHRMGVKCVAEGVETVEQLTLLRALRCDLAQGYVFSRPVPVEELSRWLATRPRSTPEEHVRVDIPALDVVDILSRHEAGASVHTIAAALNAAGRRTPRGTRWHAKSVAAIIAEAVYPEVDLRPGRHR